MSQLQRLTPSGKTGGYEGIKSSINNSKLDHRQELNKTYFRCENNLLDWFISNNYDKLLQLNPAQLFKDQVAYVIRTNNPFQLQLTDELVFKSIRYLARTLSPGFFMAQIVGPNVFMFIC